MPTFVQPEMASQANEPSEFSFAWHQLAAVLVCFRVVLGVAVEHYCGSSKLTIYSLWGGRL